jgi:hypothetical protein
MPELNILGGMFNAKQRKQITEIAQANGGGGAGGPVNLGIASKTATTLNVTSSTGSPATLPQATITEAGLLSATDKVKLNNLQSSSLTRVGNLPAGGATKVTALALTPALLPLAVADGDYYVSSSNTNNWYDLTALGYTTLVEKLEVGAKIIFNSTQNEYIYSPAGDNQVATEVQSNTVTASATTIALTSTNVQSALEELAVGVKKANRLQKLDYGLTLSTGNANGDQPNTKEIFTNTQIITTATLIVTGMSTVATPTTIKVKSTTTDYATFTVPANTADNTIIQGTLTTPTINGTTTAPVRTFMSLSQNLLAPLSLDIILNTEA